MSNSRFFIMEEFDSGGWRKVAGTASMATVVADRVIANARRVAPGRRLRLVPGEPPAPVASKPDFSARAAAIFRDCAHVRAA